MAETAPAPHEHSSARRYLGELQKFKNAPPTLDRLDGPDPLRSFEREKIANKTDLALWHTFSEGDKARFMLGYLERTDPTRATNDIERANLALSRRRIFAYILWAESDPARRPSQKVARFAYKALYGGEEPAGEVAAPSAMPVVSEAKKK